VVAADRGRPARSAEDTTGASAQTGDRVRAHQRSRLLEAIVDQLAAVGYTNVRVGDLATRAGVSRATFYEQFKNKEDCFLAAHDALAARLLARTAGTVQARPQQATSRMIGSLAEFADREPERFSFLTYEAMLAGPDALARREKLVAALADQLEQAFAVGGRGGPPLDVPAWILLGGTIRVLGIRMRRGQRASQALSDELIVWTDSYRGRDAARRRRRLASATMFLATSQRVSPGLLGPQPLPRGRHRLSATVVKRIQRERILHATAHVIRTSGYPSTTVADIVATAGVSREVFYSHFSSRSDAFVETHQLVFQEMMATTAGAFFASTGRWPEQVWQSALASTKFVLDAPSFAHFAFVEPYALGSAVARRTDDAVLAFTALLTRGYNQRPEAQKLPQATSDAIVGAIMEAVAYYVRNDRAADLAEQLPLLTYLVIAPFIGADDANEFLDAKARELPRPQSG